MGVLTATQIIKPTKALHPGHGHSPHLEVFVWYSWPGGAGAEAASGGTHES